MELKKLLWSYINASDSEKNDLLSKYKVVSSEDDSNESHQSFFSYQEYENGKLVREAKSDNFDDEFEDMIAKLYSNLGFPSILKLLYHNAKRSMERPVQKGDGDSE